MTGDAPIRVVGTAGHVDHGKSTLIRALTGIDPDRLREEQERGMTIDLGFAWLTLPGGADVGIVDVPGHQDFIRNMLAGIGGIDAVVLVVAADEGVMPQTREHLAILELLGVDRGVVALSKRDLVDDEWVALVRAEVRAALGRTPLADAPILEVSATTRRGLDELLASLESVLGAAPPRRDLGRPRLPIDRAFTMTGFGTVVTGTLVDGSVRVGEEVEVVPGGLRGRIRGLQTHRRAIEIARAGSRVAANLAGIEKDALARGMVLVQPGALRPTSLLGVRLSVLAEVSGPLEHDDTVRVHAGTAEAIARVSVLEGRAIGPGETGWVQLRLVTPLAAAVGDRLVVRRPSPSETLGGGVIADTTGERTRTRADAVAALERRSAPSAADRLLASFDPPRTPAEAGERSGLDAAERDAAYAALVAEGRAVPLADAAISREAFETLATRVERTLAMAHRKAPLRVGASREEVRSALDLPPKRYAALVARLVADGRIAERGSALALPAHTPALTAEQEARWTGARAALARAPLQPPSAVTLRRDHGIDLEVLVALADRGDLIRVGTDGVFLPDAVERFGDAIIDALQDGPMTVAKARDLTGSSRKHVLPLLQFLDDHGLTRRVGDDRVLIHDPATSHQQLHRAIHGARSHEGERQ
ncbi:MAG TPA: selenocysteine-specific translation elongation factor [Chloroflexi bacterium]|jgi:selenocysteine-specific elongation factor|nr:selenocysteine-specific translation elongation factor [Chloroflexota bacterium]HAL25531.1 selenocysteine-specific translation elongation factor [Chloroflexota bacterium]